jgi:hypothetical protein
VTEKNDYDDHNDTLPLTVREFTITHWTDRLSVHLLEHDSYCIAMRFDKLTPQATEVAMRRVLSLYKTTIYKIVFIKETRSALVDYKGETGHAWTVLENVESVYNDRW